MHPLENGRCIVARGREIHAIRCLGRGPDTRRRRRGCTCTESPGLRGSGRYGFDVRCMPRDMGAPKSEVAETLDELVAQLRVVLKDKGFRSQRPPLIGRHLTVSPKSLPSRRAGSIRQARTTSPDSGSISTASSL